jgi:hypothetical protein
VSDSSSSRPSYYLDELLQAYQAGRRDAEADAQQAAEAAQEPPSEGEVAGLVAKLRRLAPQNPLGTADPTLTRAADLLERQQPVPVPLSERHIDTIRIDALRDQSWDLRCFDMPTGEGDADIGWRVIQHHMAAPHERVVAQVYRDDPRAAIDAALNTPTNLPSEND